MAAHVLRWAALLGILPAAFAFPHVVPPQWYGNDQDRQATFAAQIKTLPLPPKTVVLERYEDLSTGAGSGGDFHSFRAGFKARTTLNFHEFRRFYGAYRFRSALYTMPFDGTTKVPLTFTHDGRVDAEGNPKPGGMIVRVEILDVAQDSPFLRSQQLP